VRDGAVAGEDALEPEVRGEVCGQFVFGLNFHPTHQPNNIMFLRQITDAHLAQNAYLIGCQRTGEAIVIDPERDVDRYFAGATENGLRITAVAETPIHAD